MKPKLFLTNTLTKSKDLFTPLTEKYVGIYSCGPTVYGFIHIGNLRSYIFADTLKRTLLALDYKVKHVINITDFGHLTSDSDEGEDKMTKGLLRENLPLTLESMRLLAQKYTNFFVQDLKACHILLPNEMPFASDHIDIYLSLISQLLQKDIAYITPETLYFDTSKDTNYGCLLGKKHSENNKENKENKEEDLENRIDATHKRNSKDFALWKFNPNLGWESSWGKGFPGWHIECSGMSMKFLGEQFDIHTGGIDHIPVHHSNEIAQSSCVTGKKPATYWLHNEFLNIAGEKMARSGDKAITLSTLTEKGFSAMEYRLLCLQSHYRSPINFSFEILEQQKQALYALYKKIIPVLPLYNLYKQEGKEISLHFEMLSALCDDLNTSKALAIFNETMKNEQLLESEKISLLYTFEELFGIPLSVLDLEKQAQEAIAISQLPDVIQNLINERLVARLEQDWQTSDSLRDQIFSLGFTIKDEKDGSQKIYTNN
jgi:cysteinyl-tRNA synthetase